MNPLYALTCQGGTTKYSPVLDPDHHPHQVPHPHNAGGRLVVVAGKFFMISLLAAPPTPSIA